MVSTKISGQAVESKQFDVVILGTGFAATVLGTILAKNGVQVLLIDAYSHPRFALGESTITSTTLTMRVLAERFSVPELKNCSAFKYVRENITSQCGVKKHFGFIYHRKGEHPKIEENIQVVIPENLTSSDAHLFRQDVDVYLLGVAVRYGAVVRQNTTITKVNIDQQGVYLEGSKGEHFQARYVVDATSYRSVVAREFDLREKPTRFKTHSRSIFTHMIDVKLYDDCITPEHAKRHPWSQGTLHHVFDGGWIWVIPFNNSPGSTNPLCSVGLNLDPRLFPKTDISPEQEFEQVIAQFPKVAEQFENAKTMRDWVSTDRLQYSSSKCVGDRFCLTAQASGAIDALFSRGLSNTCESLHLLADLLLKAVADNDFSARRFAPLERLQQNLLDYNDRLVNCAYIAFSNFDLWQVTQSVWALGGILAGMRLERACRKYLATGDVSLLSNLTNTLYPGSLAPDNEGYERFFNAVASEVEAVGEKHISASEAVNTIRSLMKEIDFLPSGIAAALSGHSKHTPEEMVEIVLGDTALVGVAS